MTTSALTCCLIFIVLLTSVLLALPQITNTRDKEAVTFKKLVKGHAYSVTAVDEVSAHAAGLHEERKKDGVSAPP